MAKTTQSTNDIQDLDLSIIRKKRFRIDGDNNKILELNTSDLNIVTRLDETYPKLKELEQAVVELQNAPEVTENSTDEELELGISEMSKILKKIDADMRECIDYIFDSNVSEICASDGSMYDPLNGQFRYEHLIDILVGLYEDNLKQETLKIKSRVKRHTSKYTKK